MYVGIGMMHIKGNYRLLMDMLQLPNRGHKSGNDHAFTQLLPLLLPSILIIICGVLRFQRNHETRQRRYKIRRGRNRRHQKPKHPPRCTSNTYWSLMVVTISHKLYSLQKSQVLFSFLFQDPLCSNWPSSRCPSSACF